MTPGGVVGSPPGLRLDSAATSTQTLGANPRPFQWTATANEILAKVQLVQTAVRKLVDNNAK